MEADSLDLRQRVLAAVDAGGHPRTELAALFRVGVAWIRRLVQRRRETGSIAPPPRLLCRGGHRPSRYMNLRTALEYAGTRAALAALAKRPPPDLLAEQARTALERLPKHPPLTPSPP